jgi:predicted RNase H-like HicB family nuclease
MTFKLLVHSAEEGGFWAEVVNLPGCFTQGETIEEIRDNAKEAILSHTGGTENPTVVIVG